MIQSLSSFTVTADYGRAHTTYNVHLDSQKAPVARVHKDTVFSSLRSKCGSGEGRKDELTVIQNGLG